jgi:hypothetical protein
MILRVCHWAGSSHEISSRWRARTSLGPPRAHKHAQSARRQRRRSRPPGRFHGDRPGGGGRSRFCSLRDRCRINRAAAAQSSAPFGRGPRVGVAQCLPSSRAPGRRPRRRRRPLPSVCWLAIGSAERAGHFVSINHVRRAGSPVQAASRALAGPHTRTRSRYQDRRDTIAHSRDVRRAPEAATATPAAVGNYDTAGRAAKNTLPEARAEGGGRRADDAIRDELIR